MNRGCFGISRFLAFALLVLWGGGGGGVVIEGI